MPCMTITINGPSKALDLLTLMKGSQSGGPGAGSGYVVSPANGIIGLVAGARVSYLSVQASPTNASNQYVYVGDENVAAGTNQGKELAPGIIDARMGMSNVSHLGEIFLLASAVGLKANIEIHWE